MPGVYPSVNDLSPLPGEGGFLPGVLSPDVDASGASVVFPAPSGLAAPDCFTLDPVVVSNPYTFQTQRYGALLHLTDFFANDMTFMADGINNLKLYNDKGYTFRASILAPKATPTATETTVVSTLRPSANNGADYCGGLDVNCRNTPYWYDNAGNYYNTILDACNNWQSVNDSTTDDVGNVEWREDNISSSSCVIQRVNWKLTAPTYTPTVDTGHSIRVRLKYTIVGAPAHTSQIIINLYQGSPYVGSGAFTTIKTQIYAHTDITTGYVNYDIALSAGEAALITDYTNLYFMIEAPGQGTGITNNYRFFSMSQAYLTLPTDGSSGIASGVYGYVFTYVRSITGAESGPSPELQFTHASSSCITLDDLEVSDDPNVDFINIYRTTNGGAEYRLVDTIPNEEPDNPTDGWYEDCSSDNLLREPNVILLDVSRKRSYRAGFPPRVRYLATYQNRLWGGGGLLDAPYVAGTALFTNGSTTVTGSGTNWTSRLEGRVIRPLSAAVVPQGPFLGPFGAVPPGLRDPNDPIEDSETYRIMKVNSATSIEIDRDFAQAGTSATYEIVDDRNPFTLYYSAAGFPEDWPVSNGIELPGEVGDGITGLIAYRDNLYVWTRNAIYVISGDDNSNFRATRLFTGVGCTSGHTVQVDERSNYINFQGDGGYYRTDGSSVQHLSSQGIVEGQAVGIDGTTDRILPSRNKMAVSLWNDPYSCMMNFCSLDGRFENEHALVWDYHLQNWSIDDAMTVSSAARVFDAQNKKAYLVGDIYGYVWQMNQSTSDGAYSGTIVATPDSANLYNIQFTGTSFADMNGVPVYIIDDDGNVFRERLLSNDDDTLSFRYPLPVVPNQFYTVIVGGIDWYMEWGWMHYGAFHKPKVLQYIEANFLPQTQGVIHVLHAVDNASLEYITDNLSTNTIKLTNQTGVAKVEIGDRGHHIKLALRSIVPGYDIRLAGLEHYVLAEGEQE